MTHAKSGFYKLSIFGKYIPTHESIMAIMVESPTYENTLITAEISNVWVKDTERIWETEKYISISSGQDLEILKLHQQLNDIEFKQFQLSGISQLDYEKFIQSKLIASWHQSIRGNFQGRNAQSHRKEIEKAIFNLTSEGDYQKEMGDVDFPEYREVENSSKFSMNRELRDACNFVILCHSTIKQLSINNQQIKDLEIQWLEASKELNKIVESLSHPGFYLYRCPYCFGYFTQDSIKIPANCGSDPCKSKYSAENKSKVRRRSNKQWVAAFDGKRRHCKECSKRKIVDSDKICKKCFT
jgi:hypothetical protein